jgi:Uma2 family endonuclease
MAARMKTEATYEDLLRLPDNVIGELIGGELYVSPRPSGPHTLFASTLGMLIGSKYHLGINGPGGWWILDEPELHLGSDHLVPDLAGWRRERMPELPKGHRFTIAPDWICETLSTSNAVYDRRKKLPIYAGHGIPWAWIADPIHRTVEVLQLVNQRWTLLGTYDENDAFAAEPFPLAEIDLPLIWREVPRGNPEEWPKP